MAENELIESTERSLQGSFHPARMNWTGATTTTTEIDRVDVEDMDVDTFSLEGTDLDVVCVQGISPESGLTGGQSRGVAVIVACASVGGKSDVDYVCEGLKYFWRRAGRQGLNYASGRQPFIYEALDEYLGFPGEAVASMSLLPVFWGHGEPEPKRLRGMFSHTSRREVLFSERLKFKTGELPRWKPKVIIGLRTFEEEDD
jgi:hypothetical protein